jgi:Rrf2 family protein
MLSRKCKYAIHALVFMAKNPHGKFLIKEVSAACSIPKKFLESIMLDLKKVGILTSKAGKGGGYYLAASPSHVNLAEIIRLFDGAIASLPCATFKFYEPCVECENEQICAIRHSLMEVRNLTVDLLKSQTLQSLIDREDQLKQVATR